VATTLCHSRQIKSPWATAAKMNISDDSRPILESRQLSTVNNLGILLPTAFHRPKHVVVNLINKYKIIYGVVLIGKTINKHWFNKYNKMMLPKFEMKYFCVRCAFISVMCCQLQALGPWPGKSPYGL
jgi:hypothetical protein